MKLNDLKNGDVVVLRNGTRYMLVDKRFVGCETEGYLLYNTYKDDMTDKYGVDDGGAFDIVQVYRHTNYSFGITRNSEKYMIWNRYEEHVDWSKLDADTPILVMNALIDDMWVKRHFAKYEDNTIYVWKDGMTSWTTNDTEIWFYNTLPDTIVKGE